jgi:hypothetical protein
MASFEDLLMQTMPFAGALNFYNVRRAETLAASRMAEEKDGTPTPDPGEFPGLFSGQTIGYDDMMVERLEVDESFEVAKPVIEPDDYNDPHPVNIWRWKHDAAAPWIISDVYCRSRGSSYVSCRVLDTLEWGLETEKTKGTLKNAIRITSLVGKQIELPLTKDFTTYKASVRGGQISSNQTDLWKLAANHDQSLVIAFVYSLEPGQPPRRMTADEANDFGEDFMPSGDAAAATGADVHGEVSADLEHPRVLVILSLTTCKQAEDFAPGSIVGMGRLYPHMMVMSSTPLARIEGTVRLNRPKEASHEGDPVDLPRYMETTFIDQFKGPKGCCTDYDGHDLQIGSIFFADANDFDISTLKGPPLPFWSNFFAYYLLDAFPAIKDETVLAVSRFASKVTRREKLDLIIRQPVTGPADYAKLIKVPFQGQFDNIHMAPKMKFNRSGVKKAIYTEMDSGPNPAVSMLIHSAPVRTFDIPLDELQVDKISMAPFCSHDCFHTHWRWGKDAKDPAQCGFAGMVPYKIPGGPLIPGNQSLELWLRAPNLLTYTATVWGTDKSPIAANTWQVIMHHGSAYALDITAFVLAYTAKMSVDLFSGQPKFYTDDDLKTEVTSPMSFSLFYWRLRWYMDLVEGKPVLKERVFNKDLRAARDL